MKEMSGLPDLGRPKVGVDLTDFPDLPKDGEKAIEVKKASR